MLFHELYTKNGVNPALVLNLVGELATHVQLMLVEGETLDVQYAKRDVVALSRKPCGGDACARRPACSTSSRAGRRERLD